ncbi:MAG: CRISPR-associated endonuclease Cas2 [Minisyncoccia bacterium]
MGKLELANRKRVRKDQLKKIMLETVKTAGLLAVAIAAPNVIGAMDKLGLIRSRRHNEVIRRSFEKHIRNGLIVRNESNYGLTKRGEAALRRLELREFRFRAPKRWDGKWRVLMFDIPEKRKKTRDKIRLLLGEIGFARLQDSVWVYPYDCEDIITLVKTDLFLEKDLLYLIADALEGDHALKKHFKLP